MNKRIKKKKLKELLENNTSLTFNFFHKMNTEEMNSLKIIILGEGLEIEPNCVVTENE